MPDGARSRVWCITIAALAAVLGCGRADEPIALSAETLAGTWWSELAHDGQRERIALAFERGEDGSLAASMAIPAIEAWHVPLGRPAIEAETGTVTLGDWVLTWDAEGPALAADLPEALVPVYSIHARFVRGETVVPSLPTDDAPEVRPAWAYEAAGPIWGGVAYAEGTVYFGDDAGVLHAVEAASGRGRWRLQTGGPIRATPALDGGSLYVPSDDGSLYRVDGADGRMRWKTGIVEGEYTRGKRFDDYAGSAAVAQGTVYLGTGDGRVLALDAEDGSTRWTFHAGDTVGSTPVVAAGRVFVGSFDGNVYALDAVTGELRWQHETGAPVSSSAAIVGDRVLIGSRSYDLLALDAATGEVRWRYYYWFSWVESDPGVAGDTAFIGSSDALKVFAIDIESGTPRWTFRTGGWTWARPAVAEEAVFAGAVGVAQYIGERRGGFFAIDRREGTALWRFLPGKPDGRDRWGFASAPVVAGDLVVAGALDGRLYGFRRDARRAPDAGSVQRPDRARGKPE